MISLFRVEVDDILQRLLAYWAEFRRFVDAHTAVLHTAVNALQAVSGTLTKKLPVPILITITSFLSVR